MVGPCPPLWHWSAGTITAARPRAPSLAPSFLRTNSQWGPGTPGGPCKAAGRLWPQGLESRLPAPNPFSPRLHTLWPVLHCLGTLPSVTGILVGLASEMWLWAWGGMYVMKILLIVSMWSQRVGNTLRQREHPLQRRLCCQATAFISRKRHPCAALTLMER